MKHLLIVFIFVFCYHAVAQSQSGTPILVSKFDDLRTVEIQYNYPDFQNPIIQLKNRNPNKQKFQKYRATKLTRFCVLNKNIVPDEEDAFITMYENPYSKRIIESIVHGKFIVSIAMLYQDDAFIYGNFRNDLLLWKDVPAGYQLIAVYPEVIGGCLFCGAQFTEYSQDTLVIEFNGGSVGEEWGGREFFTIQNDSLYFYRSERYRIFTPEKDSGNPVADAYSKTIKKFFYNRSGRLVNSEVIFDARYEDQSPVKLFCQADSLRLYKALPNFQSVPLTYVKTVSIDKQQIRVGPVQGTLIPVFLNGEWYLTNRSHFSYKPHSQIESEESSKDKL